MKRVRGGNVAFERFGQLLVHELERKAFLEVSHHPGLDLAGQDKGFLLNRGMRQLRVM